MRTLEVQELDDVSGGGLCFALVAAVVGVKVAAVAITAAVAAGVVGTAAIVRWVAHCYRPHHC